MKSGEFSVLIDSFLIYEEIELDDSFLYDYDTQEQRYDKALKNSIKEIEIRLKSVKSLEVLQNSPEYLSWFYMKFERFVGYDDSYLELIRKYYSTENQENTPKYGLIKNLELENNTYKVTATFSPIKSASHPSFYKEGVGFGQDIHVAFFNSLKDWLDKHHDITKLSNK